MEVRNFFKSAITTFAIYFCVLSCAQASKWPRIQAGRHAFHLDDKTNSAFVFNIDDKEGHPAYLFEAYANAYDRNDDCYTYTGIFECRLRPANDNGCQNLLREEGQSKDWQSRARFLLPEIVGKYAEYPDFGRVRTFLLRGMRLTVRLSNIVADSRSGEDPPVLKSADLEVEVESDRNVDSNIAESSANTPSPIFGRSLR